MCVSEFCLRLADIFAEFLFSPTIKNLKKKFFTLKYLSGFVVSAIILKYDTLIINKKKYEWKFSEIDMEKLGNVP